MQNKTDLILFKNVCKSIKNIIYFKNKFYKSQLKKYVTKFRNQLLINIEGGYFLKEDLDKFALVESKINQEGINPETEQFFLDCVLSVKDKLNYILSSTPNNNPKIIINSLEDIKQAPNERGVFEKKYTSINEIYDQILSTDSKNFFYDYFEFIDFENKKVVFKMDSPLNPAKILGMLPNQFLKEIYLNLPQEYKENMPLDHFNSYRGLGKYSKDILFYFFKTLGFDIKKDEIGDYIKYFKTEQGLIDLQNSGVEIYGNKMFLLNQKKPDTYKINGYLALIGLGKIYDNFDENIKSRIFITSFNSKNSQQIIFKELFGNDGMEVYDNLDFKNIYSYFLHSKWNEKLLDYGIIVTQDSIVSPENPSKYYKSFIVNKDLKNIYNNILKSLGNDLRKKLLGTKNMTYSVEFDIFVFLLQKSFEEYKKNT